jgi:hypothetical protein
MKSQKINLLRYSHNRADSIKKTTDDLFDLINLYSDQTELFPFYNYFENKYNIPRSVVQQKIKNQIGLSYQFKKGKFIDKLRLINTPLSLLKYLALLYALFFTRKDSEVKKYKLIIDDVCSEHELERFEKIINLVGKENTLVILRNVDIENKNNYEGYNFYNKKLFQDLNKTDLFKTILNELFYGVWVVLRASVKTRLNLFPFSLQVIHSFLSFKTLFENYNAEYLLQERHYSTNPVKNYLFKKNGGISTTTIQKNIMQLDPMYFFMDIDVLFSFGTEGFERAIEYGGNIGKVLPVGSFFMEHYWFKNKKKYYKKFDVLFIGQNISNAIEREDKFSKFNDDYYDCFRWLVKFHQDYPKLSIAIMHHASAGFDKFQNHILKGTLIEVLDQSHNTYSAALSANCNVTYGSSMGYELIGHNIPTVFMDPGYRCTYLPELKQSKTLDSLRAQNYKEFTQFVYRALKESKKCNPKSDLEKICLESDTVSNKINQFFSQ